MFSISIRTHGALLLLTELARSGADSRVRLADISKKWQLSEAYLEEAASKLKIAGLVEGKTGPGGGYRLAKPPSDIALSEVLEILEGPLALVDCQKTTEICPVAEHCHSKDLWKIAQTRMKESLQGIQLDQVL